MSDVRLEKIYELYRNILNREADEPGAANYYNSKLSLEEIETILLNSPERRMIEKRQNNGGFEFDEIEPWLLVGSSVSQEALDKVSEAGICYLLEIFKTDTEYPEDFQVLRLGLPDNSVMSVADVKKSLLFIQKAKKSGKKLLIFGRQGLRVAVAVAVLWYVANGFDEQAATFLVESRRSECDIDSALLGPWHFEAAEAVFK